VLAINSFFTFNKYKKKPKNKYSICEALSATGLRAIRYHVEFDKEFVEEIIANDMDIKAVDCINRNTLKNNITEKFKTYQKEATQLLYSNLNNFDVIDLDPYGSAIPLIDSALVSVKSEGLLCVTFTDMSVLCGNYPETCYYKYGSIPYRTPFCHEVIKF
jgi:tRNA (guanine26-N2/guanine27-N2)-dimethyltransferase